MSAQFHQFHTSSNGEKTYRDANGDYVVEGGTYRGLAGGDCDNEEINAMLAAMAAKQYGSQQQQRPVEQYYIPEARPQKVSRRSSDSGDEMTKKEKKKADKRAIEELYAALSPEQAKALAKLYKAEKKERA